MDHHAVIKKRRVYTYILREGKDLVLFSDESSPWARSSFSSPLDVITNKTNISVDYAQKTFTFPSWILRAATVAVTQAEGHRWA